MAQELAQEALARVCSSWDRVRKMEHPGAWTQRVAINLANSHFRRKLTEQLAKQRLDAVTSHTSNEPDTASAVAIRKALAALPRRQRAVLILHYYGDLSFTQIAGTLGMPEGTVKSLARRAVLKLRRDSGLVDFEEATNV